jgi:signal transduction histidine kinase
MQAGAPQTPSRSWLIAAGATVVAGAIGFVWNRYPVIVARTGLYAVATTRSGWRVYTMVPNLAIFARSSNQNMLILGYAMGLLIVLLALMRLLSRQVTRPLGLLAAQASNMTWDGAGRLGAALPSAIPNAPSEVAVVAQAFALADERIWRAAREEWDALAMRDAALEERDQSLRTLEARVRERTEDLRTALARVEAASMAKSAFLANMSHELRTPLNAILGTAEILEEGLYAPLTSQQLELVQTVDSSGRHLLALIQDILDISRIESGRLALEITEIDLDEVIRHVVTTLSARATAANLDVRVEIPAHLRPVRADHLRLTQVFDNLVTNAIKFTDAGGAVTVSVRADADGTVREALVRDTGIGIPEAMQARVFEPFEQGSVTLRRAKGGSGLGLAIVRSLCAAMHLTLTLESVPGTGTTFRIGFPDPHGK